MTRDVSGWTSGYLHYDVAQFRRVAQTLVQIGQDGYQVDPVRAEALRQHSIELLEYSRVLWQRAEMARARCIQRKGPPTRRPASARRSAT